MRHFILAFLIIFIAAFKVSAATSTYELSEIVVTGGGFDEEERKTTANTIVYDQEAIESSSAVTVSEFLQDSGFAVIPGPTPFSDTSITIRGFDNGHHWNESSSRIVFLINGRRSGVNNIRQLAINNVERIEIIRGPEMYKYSAGSPGGIVNIITKRGGEDVISGSLEGGVGSFDHYKGQVALDGSPKDFDYSLAYMYETFDNYKDGRGHTVTNSKTNAINAFNGGIGYTILDNHRIGLEYYYYDVDAAQKPQYWDEEEGILKDPSYVDRTTQIAALTYEGKTRDERFNWSANYAISRDEYISVSDPAKRHSQNWMGNKIETNQLRADINYIGDWLDLSTGADYMRYKTHNSGTPKPQFGWPNGYPMHLGHITENTGIFGLGTIKLFDNEVNITGGLRWDYARIKDKHTGDEPWWDGRKDPWYGEYTGDRMPTERKFYHLSPSVGITYLPLDWLKLRANYVKGFRAPGGRQLFSSDETEGYGAPGFPRLLAEKSDNYEAGFDLNWANADFSFSYFYSEFKNHITIRGIQYPTGLGPSAQNADERIQSGIELAGSINLAGLAGISNFEVRPYASMTYMTKYDELFMRDFDGSNLTPPSYAGDWAVINGIPKYTANYGIRFRHFDWGTSANLNFFYFGETWSGASPGNYNPGIWETYGKFTIANLSVQQRLVEFKDYGQLGLKFQANNLFDEAYKYSTSNSDVLYQGRNFYLGLVFDF